MFTRSFLATLLVFGHVSMVHGEEDIFAEYRAMFGDDSPAILVEMDGEALWSTPAGCERPNLGIL